MRCFYSVRRGRRFRSGFTLIELVTTLAVLAITAMIAVPSFTTLINNNRLATASNELVDALQFARMEAVRRNARVVVCSSADAHAATPACGGTDWRQWIVFADRDDNDAVSTGEVLRVGVFGTSLQVQAGGAIKSATESRFQNRVVFFPDGLSHAQGGALLAASLNVCIKTTRPQQNRRDVEIAGGSRIRVVTPAGNAECPAP